MVAGRKPMPNVEAASNEEAAAANMEAEVANVEPGVANLEPGVANVEVRTENVEVGVPIVEAGASNVEGMAPNVAVVAANVEEAAANVATEAVSVEAAAVNVDAELASVKVGAVNIEAEAQPVKAAAAENITGKNKILARPPGVAPAATANMKAAAANITGTTKILTRSPNVAPAPANVVIPTLSVPIKKLDTKTKLIRFCYLGAFDCIALFRLRDVEVKKWLPEMKKLCKEIDCQVFGEVMLKMLLQTPKLIRKDETLFAYACYLIADIDKSPKFSMRSQFNALVLADDDLFLFAKYAMQIQLAENHKGFSKTHRKAIISWYNMRTEQELNSMWMMHRGAYGFTHKSLIMLCHIPESKFESDAVVNAYFRSCTELVREWESIVKGAEEERKKREEQGSDQESVTSVESTETAIPVLAHADAELTPAAPPATLPAEPKPTIFVLMSQLRITTDFDFALKIIRDLKLRYNQIPFHLLKNNAIMDEALETMSHWPLLNSWRSFHRFNHFKRQQFTDRFKNLILEKRGAESEDIHPYVYLWKMTSLGLHPDFDRRAHPNPRLPRRHETVEGFLIKEIYEKSFKQNFKQNNFHMHITINMQTNYRKKMPQKKRKVTFLETSVVLAFGYFQMNVADVFCWTKYPSLISPVNFNHGMNVSEAIAVAQNCPGDKNKQLLATPIQCALRAEKIYDVFLVIVPTSGRGNKRMSSHGLCTKLDKYREEKNPNAKLIILDLLKHKKSMNYSKERVENILNICGIDNHTPDLIKAFINGELI